MKKVLMVAHFCDYGEENSNNRFNYLFNLMKKNNINVQLLTSDFCHRSKEHRKENKSNIDNDIKLIHEPGYKKNICLKRFYSHFVFSKNLKKYLNQIDKPDIIYCSIPSIDVAYEVAKYAMKNKIKFYIDVQDIWPEAFQMIFNVPIISYILFYPMKKKVEFCYKSADEIIAVSQTYANRARFNNNKVKKTYSVYLGTDLDYFDSIRKIKKSKNEFKLVYIGTLGHSYDLTTVFNAMVILKEEFPKLKLIIMGDGPLKEKFEREVENLKINVEFTGRLSYEEMVGILSSCDIAINPIMHGAAGSIINKVGDYAAAGLPIISTQECKEYRDLLKSTNSGITCENSNIKDIADNIRILIKNDELRLEMGKNSRRVAELFFNRKNTYNNIINLIINS